MEHPMTNMHTSDSAANGLASSPKPRESDKANGDPITLRKSGGCGDEASRRAGLFAAEPINLAPVLIGGAPILNEESMARLTRSAPPLPMPKLWLEAKACLRTKSEAVRPGLSRYWRSDPARRARAAGLSGAKEAIRVLKENRGRRNQRQLAGWVEESCEYRDHHPAVVSALMRFWSALLLVAVFFASIYNGAKLVLLAKHRLFGSLESAVLLSAIFSIAPVVLYEWVAHQLSPKARRKLDRVLQVTAVPFVLAGLATFAWSFGSQAENPLTSIVNGVPPSGPNWGLVILANLVVEMYSEIALWSGLRERVQASPRTESDLTGVEIQSAELESLDARLSVLMELERQEEEAWVEGALAYFEARRALARGKQIIARSRAQASLLETGLEIE